MKTLENELQRISNNGKKLNEASIYELLITLVGEDSYLSQVLLDIDVENPTDDDLRSRLIQEIEDGFR